MHSKKDIVYDSKGNLYQVKKTKKDKKEEEENSSSSDEERVNKTKKNKSSKQLEKKKRERSSSPSSDSESSDDEITSIEDMKEKKAREELKEYRRSKKFVRDFEKKKKENEEIPEWKQADDLFTQAASIGARLQGLIKKSLKEDSHLLKAIPKLKDTGEKKFNQAQKIISKLNPEDSEKFWANQVRNKNAKSFDELVTKTKHKEDMIEETIKTRIKTALKERGIEDIENPKQGFELSQVDDMQRKENLSVPENSSNVEVNTKDGQQETIHLMEVTNK
jgi:hypothetical protein